MSDRVRESGPSLAFLDLEVALDGHLREAGMVVGEQEVRIDCRDLGSALDRMAEVASGADFLAGHNLLWHDLPWIEGVRPNSALLRMPVLDSLLLSPLAAPRRPYHRLVKDYKLQRESGNDPVADARLSRQLLEEEAAALACVDRELLGVIAECVSPTIARRARSTAGVAVQVAEAGGGYKPVEGDFDQPRASPRAGDGGGHARLLARLGAQPCGPAGIQSYFDLVLADRICATTSRGLVARHRQNGSDALELALVASWLRVADPGSVLPAWARRTFPGVRDLITELRDRDCGGASCAYCRSTHDADQQLRDRFGFGFREKPGTADGRSLQRCIVECGMRGGSLLGILPTGGGKSVCFQLPALVRHERRGALTVVLSPLQALMQDQVDNLKERVGGAVAMLNGLLTPPQRGDSIERVRLGEVAILYLSPEQLRSSGCARLLAQREIGAWVFDEAHCLTKWGHDFRPDYLYASRFIRERAEKDGVPVPPIVCLTATARRAVRDEILEHFRQELGIELELFESGVKRDNLEFAVELVPPAQKTERIRELVADQLQSTLSGAVIVYCSRRRESDDRAEHLTRSGLNAVSYHAGLDTAVRGERQRAFVDSEVRVICATNAFGMGVDKSDVRLVVHAQMPPSLENYLQEAGRAGRDGSPARCVLLHSTDDVEAQFQVLAASRLSKADLEEIWRALKRRVKREDQPIVVTSGELLSDAETATSFDPSGPNASTRVVTAIAWLERGGFVRRDENRASASSVRLLARDRSRAHAMIEAAGLDELESELWLCVWRHLLQLGFDARCDTDALAELPAFRRWEAENSKSAGARVGRLQFTPGQKALRVIRAMAKAGLVTTSTTMTAFLRDRVREPSRQRFERGAALERGLLDLLPELAPDAEDFDGETGQRRWQILSLRRVNQSLRDRDIDTDVSRLKKTLAGLAHDGQGLAGSRGSLELGRIDAAEIWQVRLRRTWREIGQIAETRRAVASVALRVMEGRIDRTKPASANQLVEFTYEDVERALAEDLTMHGTVKDPLAAIERGLLWLNEQKVVVLQGGLTVFRRAMTIGVRKRGRDQVLNKDYAPLEEHYQSQQEGVHVVARYAEIGAQSMRRANALVGDYFSLGSAEFRRRYFAGEEDVLAQATTAESLRRIVGDLRNQAQEGIVTSDVERNLLILAGPGSGKTKVVVHRCAWLLRVQRVPPRSILLLCFNRSTAHALRRRLVALIGDDARSVTIATYHGFAARLCGRSFAERGERGTLDVKELDALLEEAVLTLQKGADELDAEARREELLAGYRFILVDEYQDIDEVQYRLIAALAGGAGEARTAEHRRLALLAVGDDDQSIYGFRHTSVEFIRRFEADYDATRHSLLDNYRSTSAIVAASNCVIAANADRMKCDPIRAVLEPAQSDARVEILEIGASRGRSAAAEAVAIADRVESILGGSRRASPDECAVLARTWRTLDRIRAVLETRGIEVRIGIRAGFPRGRVVEIATWLDLIESRERAAGPLDATALGALRDAVVATYPESPWTGLLQEIADACIAELVGGGAADARSIREFVHDALAEERRESAIGRGVELRTIHSAKGLEFDHVVVADLKSKPVQTGRELEEERRLLYVAMTRARRSLTLMQRRDSPQPHLERLGASEVARRRITPTEATLAAVPRGGRYEALELSSIHIDWASRRAPNAPTHLAQAGLCPGAALRMVDAQPRIALVDGSGCQVGELSAAGSEVWRPRLHLVRSVLVLAMLRRGRSDLTPEYQEQCRVDRWLYPLVEVLWDEP